MTPLAISGSVRALVALAMTMAVHPVKAEPASPIRFTDATASSGIELVMTSGTTPSREILEVNGGGVAMLDYDNDGDIDLFLANGATMEDPEHGPGSRLYANNGDGTFRDVTEAAGVELRRWAMGVAVGDYNADGFDDIYVTCYGPNVLLRNEPDGAGGRRFVDASTEAGVADPRWGSSAAFGDIDGDGDLDLYVVNYLEFDVENPPYRGGKSYRGMPVMAGPAGLVAQSDVLYENRGDGSGSPRFADITEASGCVPREPGYGLGVVILDLDGDGLQDIFVGNDSTENFLFRNLGGGKFEEIGVFSGVSANYEGVTQASMGIAVGDVDGNGYADLFTTNFASDTNTLHLNLGEGIFDDRTSQYGLALVSRPYLAWGTGLFDFDGDGDEDVFIANGHVYPRAEERGLDAGYAQLPLLFERRGRRFHIQERAGEVFRSRYVARAVAFGDIDDDGDVDIVMTTLNGPVRVLRNDSPSADVAVIELRGRRGNRRGLGSTVELRAGGLRQHRWIHGGSYQSVNAPAAYFGLGTIAPGTTLDVRVRWPGGQTAVYRDVPRDRRIVLMEGRGEAEP